MEVPHPVEVVPAEVHHLVGVDFAEVHHLVGVDFVNKDPHSLRIASSLIYLPFNFFEYSFHLA